MRNIIGTEVRGLDRDLESKALLNNNMASLIEYRTRKNIAISKENKEKETQLRLEKIEINMAEIKNLLIEIVTRNK